MKNKLFFVLFLVFILAFSVSCGKPQNNPQDGTKPGNASESSEVTMEPELISVYLEKTESASEKYGKHPALLLWSEESAIPGFSADENAPTVSPYLAGNTKAPALVLVSGNDGASYDKEAADEAISVLNDRGYHVFVLNYRFNPENAEADVQRAIRFVKFYASEFNVSFTGAIGFEAGAVALMNASSKNAALNADEIDSKSSLPDLQILGSPKTEEWPAFSEKYPMSLFYYKTGSDVAVSLLKEAETVLMSTGVRFELHGLSASTEAPRGFGLDDALYGQITDIIFGWFELNYFK